MKVYLVTDADLEQLRANLARNPQHGLAGGGSVSLTPEELRAHEEAHRFFWYQVLRWIDTIKEPMR